MAYMNDGKIKIQLDKERDILFSLNAIAEIQERYGNMEAMPEKIQADIKEMRWLLWLLLVEGGNDDIKDEKQVGRMIHTGNMSAVVRGMMSAFADSMPEAEEGEEDDPGNAGEGEV